MIKLSLALLLPLVASAAQTDRDELFAIYKQLIETNTTHSTGSTTVAAQAMADRFLAAGFPASDVQVFGPTPNRGNLVVRFRGAGTKKPMLLLAHLDVVEAKREDWSVDPFHLLEKDGFYYGRGTSDDKAEAAAWVATLLRFKREGVKPDRDIILALTADEEAGDNDGAKWLVENHRDLIDAEFCINEGGRGMARKGKRLFFGVQASEKTFVTFALDTKNPGGHSSRPGKQNAIYSLAGGLTRIEQYQFPLRLNPVTEAYFEKMGRLEPGPLGDAMEKVTHQPPDAAAVALLSESPYYNALLHTTCVVTQITGGHAENALPQSAKATVNCRMLPGDTEAVTRQALVAAVHDPSVNFDVLTPSKKSPPSELTPLVMDPIKKIAGEMWPGVPVIPTMSTGATDSIYMRGAGIPSYGVQGWFTDIDDQREHGKDERMPIDSFYNGYDFLYRLVTALAGAHSEAPEAAIRRTLDDQIAAWNRGDLVKFVDTYLDSDETLFIGSTIARGRAQLLDRYQKRYDTRAKMGELTFTDIEIKLLDPAHATVVGHFHLKRETPPSPQDSGVFSLILVLTPQGWKIMQDHTS